MNRRGFLGTTFAAAVAAVACPVSALVKAAAPESAGVGWWNPAIVSGGGIVTIAELDKLFLKLYENMQRPLQRDFIYASPRMAMKLQKPGIPTRSLT